MATVTFYVDDRKMTAEENALLLPILLKAGKDIPHLCDSDQTAPFAACRLCLVEIEENGRKRTHSSCSFPVKEGIRVFTRTPAIEQHRRMVAELLLARSPKVPEIQALAKRLGVAEETRFQKYDKGCILCGLCTRVCRDVVGVAAISFSGRGADKKVTTPFTGESRDCIGCGSCYFVCPVNYVRMEETATTREFPQWKATFKLVKCTKCGQTIGTDRELEHFKKRVTLPEGWFDVCTNCR